MGGQMMKVISTEANSLCNLATKLFKLFKLNKHIKNKGSNYYTIHTNYRTLI